MSVVSWWKNGLVLVRIVSKITLLYTVLVNMLLVLKLGFDIDYIDLRFTHDADDIIPQYC